MPYLNLTVYMPEGLVAVVAVAFVLYVLKSIL